MRMGQKIWFPLMVTLAAVAWNCGRAEAVQTTDPATLTLVNFGGDCTAKAADCCHKPCIEYHTRRPCRKVCCDCKAPQKLTLTVKDPCCCTACAVQVPVCVPACCKGEPCVDGRCNILGRGVLTYSWCCGYKMTVAFKKCGDVVVTYFGS